MQKGVCKLSIVPMRAEPDGRSELVSQLLFGETYTVTGRQGDWINIETHTENYPGWINANQFCEWAAEGVVPMQMLKKFPMTEAVNLASQGRVYLLPGSILHRFETTAQGACFYINHEKYTAPLVPEDLQHLPGDDINAYALGFLNSPYLWGGKSMWGIDCSGFTQLIYKAMGMQIPRDAWQQALEGNIVNFVNEVMPADLAFFDNEEGRITHVGLMLAPGEILHASGKVRLDVLDSYGIYNSVLCKHTHKLRVIKRLLA